MKQKYNFSNSRTLSSRKSHHFNNSSKYKSWKAHENNLCSNIFWCKHCNIPLLDSTCDLCKSEGSFLKLSSPGDIRFCSPVERDILNQLLLQSFNCNPIEQRIILLNKIPGEDRTDEVIVDGFIFGILRFDMKIMDYTFDLSIQGSKILLNSTFNKTVELYKVSSHLNGKKVKFNQIAHITEDIVSGDTILIKSGKLTGFGTYIGDDVDSKFALRVKKIDNTQVYLNPNIATINDVIAANSTYINKITKDAINLIKGLVYSKKYISSMVNVAFSGGKDSLVVLDLTKDAVDKNRMCAFFLNTGIEFPETLEFVHKFCNENNINLKQVSADNNFWNNLDTFGPPAKDMRWCCKICKLGPANTVMNEILKQDEFFITVDGKRKYESFSRSSIAATENNPFVPHQINIFPIRNWRAIEVWLYIYSKKLTYNPLYDLGFERVGCYLCPASLSAEYKFFSKLHPKLYKTWDNFLKMWAKNNKLSDAYIKHGFWRWKALPPKMLKLAEELNINYLPQKIIKDGFKVKALGGISPCKDGSFSIEASIEGISFEDVFNILPILGNIRVLEDMGMYLIQNENNSIKFFSSGNLVVSAKTKEKASKTLDNVVLQFMRQSRCSRCGICKNTCPVNAIEIDEIQGLLIKNNCIKCGKCNNVCSIIKYAPKTINKI